MARTKQTVSIDEKIIKAQETVEKAKEKYEAAVKELRNLMDKKEALKKQELFKSIENSNKTYDEIQSFLCQMAQVNEMELKEAYQVLNEMMNTFEGWFPIDESDTKDEIETYKERFAATKLCLELGEYTRDDYEYLFFVCDKVVERKLYYRAINVFISALSEEYGWI